MIKLKDHELRSPVKILNIVDYKSQRHAKWHMCKAKSRIRAQSVVPNASAVQWVGMEISPFLRILLSTTNKLNLKQKENNAWYELCWFWSEFIMIRCIECDFLVISARFNREKFILMWCYQGIVQCYYTGLFLKL